MKFMAWLTALAFLVAPMALSQETQKDPVDSGLVEQAERRLMQIDVTARGPAETVAALTAKDFSLAVGLNDIDEFTLDRICIEGGIEGLDLSDPEVAAAAPRLRTLLFFDQTHLTSLGRQRSMELARELIPKLLGSGRSEAMIISANRRLDVVAEWSSDPAVLLAAMEELVNDLDQVSGWADGEDSRVDRMMAALDRVTEFTQEEMMNSGMALQANTEDSMSAGIPFGSLEMNQARARVNERQQIEVEAGSAMKSAKRMARVVARDLSREEAGRTAGGLSLFSASLVHFDGYAPPKAVLYFADTMRANAGDHFIGLVKSTEGPGRLSGEPPEIEGSKLSQGNYVTEFQQAIDNATEKGVRFYTVQGRGLTPAVAARGRSGGGRRTDPRSARVRFKDAENALSGFASETGGKAFLGAADASQIAARILDDLSCLFVLSFHALDMKEDRSTAVWIDIDKPGVELTYRPKLIAFSAASRERARLASAFWSGDRSADRARVLAVPTGFENGKYTVLVQFAMAGAALGGSDWDMGVTAVINESRTLEASGRVAVNQAGLPLVFEAEMQFKPGDYAITAVAKNNTDGTLVSTRAEGSLPDPNDREPFIAGIALLQRAPGAFVRGEATKTSGSLAHGPTHWMRPDRATGILALVCGNKRAADVTAGRSLVGASEVNFDPVELDFGEERCGLLVDTIDGSVLTSGKFSYAVDLNRGEESVGESLREFLVVSQEEIALAKKESGGQSD